MPPLLVAEGLSLSFRGIRALDQAPLGPMTAHSSPAATA
jgi:hypothetical protein